MLKDNGALKIFPQLTDNTKPNPTHMTLSLLVAYRNRPLHLKCLLEWFTNTVHINPGIELILIESSPKPTLVKEPGKNIKYVHVQEDGNFNKARLLNIGLGYSVGKLVSSYDVDLVPVDLSFKKHLLLAEESEVLLVSGYRLNCGKEYINVEEIEQERLQAAICVKEECSESFLREQLVQGHRYGVIPLFNRERLIKAGAWDERFEGWGAEDKDVIERYLGGTRHLVRCPDLIYLHLNHEEAAGWNDLALTRKNDSLYYEKRALREIMIKEGQ